MSLCVSTPPAMSLALFPTPSFPLFWPLPHSPVLSTTLLTAPPPTHLYPSLNRYNILSWLPRHRKMKPFPATAPQGKSHVRNWRSKGHLAQAPRRTLEPPYDIRRGCPQMCRLKFFFKNLTPLQFVQSQPFQTVEKLDENLTPLTSDLWIPPPKSYCLLCK